MTDRNPHTLKEASYLIYPSAPPPLTVSSHPHVSGHRGQSMNATGAVRLPLMPPANKIAKPLRQEIAPLPQEAGIAAYEPPQQIIKKEPRIEPVPHLYKFTIQYLYEYSPKNSPPHNIIQQKHRLPRTSHQSSPRIPSPQNFTGGNFSQLNNNNNNKQLR